MGSIMKNTAAELNFRSGLYRGLFTQAAHDLNMPISTVCKAFYSRSSHVVVAHVLELARSKQNAAKQITKAIRLLRSME